MFTTILMNKSYYLKTLFFYVTFFFIAISVFSQPEINFESLKQKYPEDDVLVLEKRLDMRIAMENGVPEVLNDYKQVFVFLTDKANYYSTKTIGFSDHFEELRNLEAVSFVPEKGKMKKYISDPPKVTNAKSGDVFYDDSKEASITFKSLQKGSIAILSYTIKSKDPHLLHPFTFGGYAPVARATLNIEFPDGVSLNPKTYGNKNIPVIFKALKKKNKNTWSWEAENLEKYEMESNAPEYDFNTLKIFPLMKDYFNGKKSERVLSDVNDLFAWYMKQVEGLNDSNPAELKTLADSLTQGKTELEKIKSVYYWVQDNISYIAIEDGWGGFVPRKADDVYRKRYGDCKDMANLATTLLNLAGIKACLTWIGTRDIPYSYNEVPSSASDNHMISALQMKGEWIFLDATAAFIDFGLPSSSIQGKEGLIMLSKDSFLLFKVEPVSKQINLKTDTMEISIENRQLTGTGHCTLNGYWKWYMVNSYLGKHVNTRYSDMKKYFETGNNKCKVDTVIYNADLKSRDVPLQLTYQFSVPDYIKIIGNEQYINLNLDKALENNNIDTAQRKNPYEIKYKSTEVQVVKLSVPAAMKVGFVPPDRHYENDLIGFYLSYVVKGNVIILSRIIYYNTLELGKEHFKEWNAMTTELNKAYKELVILKEK